MSRWISIVSLLLILSGCGYYHHVKQKPDNGFRDFSSAGLDFATIKSNVLVPYCLSCHSADKATPSKPALETYAQVFALRQTVRDDVNFGLMPLDGPLPAEETQALFAWIDAGAPEVGQKVGAPTYTEMKARLFEPLCIECHASYGTYEKVVKRIDEIQVAIENNEMPKDAAPVSDELKAMLAQWIAQGMPR